MDSDSPEKTTSRRKKGSEDKGSDDEDDTLELPDHNYSPSLILNNLCDGCFNAHIPMTALPRGKL